VKLQKLKSVHGWAQEQVQDHTYIHHNSLLFQLCYAGEVVRCSCKRNYSLLSYRLL